MCQLIALLCCAGFSAYGAHEATDAVMPVVDKANDRWNDFANIPGNLAKSLRKRRTEQERERYRSRVKIVNAKLTQPLIELASISDDLSVDRRNKK